MADAKIVGVIDEAPFDYRTWSGSSAFFFGEIKRKGHLVEAISAEASNLARRVSQLRNFHPDIAKWKFKYHLDTDLFASMTNAAKSTLSAVDQDYNVVLQVGAWYDLTSSDKLNISYHDGNLATRLSSPFGYPKVNSRHIDRALSYEKALYHKLDLIFPMSSWLADSFIRDFNVPAKKVFPIGAGINLPKIADTANKEYDGKTLLMVGKDFERKGGRYLLEAFRMVRKAIPNAELRIIGPQPTSEEPGVTYLGFVNKNTDFGLQQLLDEYTKASVFVLPSLYEPFGISFAEAMAHRLPCVGTNICAMNEIISDKETGYLVTPRDSKALADKLLALLSSPAMCADMGNKGYLRYEERYTWEVVTNKLISITQNKLGIL